MSRPDPTWKEVVERVLRQLGGEARLADIYEKVDGHPKTATNPTWRDTIRRVVRQYRIFQPIPPEGSGRYRLVDVTAQSAAGASLDSVDPEITHGIAQGMIVSLGTMYGYPTFVPTRDQSTRRFQNKLLGDWVTVRQWSGVITGKNVASVREIDALWFDEDDDGLYPAYAFEVEHSTKVKSGLDRLLKIPMRFNTKLFVIGPGDEERGLFDRLVQQTPFRQHRERFVFKDYGELGRLYRAALDHRRLRSEFDVLERVSAA